MAQNYARDLDQKIAGGCSLQGLEGVFLAIKDNIHARGFETTCSSKILKGYLPAFESPAVSLLRQEGACILGKTNCDEFAMGSSNENSAFGPVRNPRDRDRVPGGSSGGSAAAVAALMCSAALGSDTGGSIRQPAAFCGVVGFKPTYGRISRRGLVAFASSLDQIGPITHTVGDASILYKIMAKPDAHDSTSLTNIDNDSLCEVRLKGATLGIVEEFFPPELDSMVQSRLESSLKNFEKAGGNLTRVSLPHLKYSLPAYYILACAEASSNLARYDSIRYGNREYPGVGIEELYQKERSLGLGDEVKRRMILGAYVLSEGYYEAFYRKAQKVRSLIRTEMENALRSCDALVGPTTPTLPFLLGSKVSDPMEMYYSDLFTVIANITSAPAISIPCQKSEDALPVGIQLIGKPFEDSKILSLAEAVENLVNP